MKVFFYLVSLIFLTACFATSCTESSAKQADPLAIAEEAFADGYYAKAQQIADSMVLGTSMSNMGASELCRLSLLFMRLGEVGGEDNANIAFAARVLEAADRVDKDSTDAFIAALPVDDRARLVLAEAVAEGSRHKIEADSLTVGSDSLTLEGI